MADFGIWNCLDEVCYYLSTTRLDGETDDDLTRRMKLLSKYKYKTDYYTQAHSIPLQLGLNTYNLFNIYSDHDFICTVDWEYFTLESLGTDEYYRIFINNEEATINKILEQLNNSTVFSYTKHNGIYDNTKCKYLIRNSNLKIETEYINTKRTKLKYGNILKNKTIVTWNKKLSTSNTSINKLITNTEDLTVFTNEVSSIADLKCTGDFYIDYTNGYIELYDQETNGFFVTYQYLEPIFTVESTDINLIPMNEYFKYGITDKCIEAIPFILNNKVWA